jgi:hypothetical protein
MTNQTQTPRDAAIEDALTAYEQQVGDGKWSESGIVAAINAYEQARADERRALVDLAVDKAMALQAVKWGTPMALKVKADFDAAERALLDLCGATREEVE